MSTRDDEWIEELQGPKPSEQPSQAVMETPEEDAKPSLATVHRLGDFRILPDTHIKGFDKLLS